MIYNLINYIQNCNDIINSNSVTLGYVYYSHIPSIIVSILISLVVYFKNKKLLIGKILLALAISFSLWSIFDLFVWRLTYDSRIVMISWALLGILDILFFIFSLYFVYVFIDKKDISFKKKIILGLLFLPIVILAATRFNLLGFDVAICEAVENNYYVNYTFVLEILISVWIIILSIQRYIKADKQARKQILLLSIGIILFLLSFFTSGFIADQLENFKLEQFGLFGMTIFLGFLAYLIVKYHAFNIKLIATQALVTALVVLIGSELFFADSTSNQILILVTLAISLGFGYILIKSVKMEVQRKEELQMMSDKLAQANDKLRKLDNAKTEFISIASHQLRTPLTAIKGFISLLLEGSYGKLNKKHEDVLNKVYTSNERLITLVEDLLNISRIESGRMEFTFQKWDMAKICSDLVDTFSLKAKGRGLYLDYKKPDHSLPEVETDGAKLREVISNLIDNAIKYTPKGGLSIRITQADKNIQIVIADTGIGIPREELPYLFSKFSRGKDISRLNAGGTGLGLYVGKSVMEAIGGKVWAESDGAGKGSKFIVEVPIAHKEEK